MTEQDDTPEMLLADIRAEGSYLSHEGERALMAIAARSDALLAKKDAEIARLRDVMRTVLKDAKASMKTATYQSDYARIIATLKEGLE